MKKTKVFLSFIFLSFAYFLCSNVYASSTLITIDSKVITDDMKINDIVSLFGEPTVSTDSVFKGKAYSFTSSDYKRVLFIETNNLGEIVVYGCLSEDFVSVRRSAGDIHNGVYSYLSGYVPTKSGSSEIIGTIEYVSSRVPYGNEYWNMYELVEEDYIFNLNYHALEMAKVVNRIGSTTGLVVNHYDNKKVDKSVFQYSRQLLKNGTDLYYYCYENSLSSLFKFASSSNTTTTIGYLPNPLMMGDKFKMQGSPSNYEYFLSDIYLSDYETGSMKLISGTVDINLFKERVSIELTDKEKLLAGNAKSYYDNYITNIQLQGGTTFESTPSISIPLDAGKIFDSNLQASTDILNMIRAGAGIDPVVHSTGISNAAQAKAVLTVYLGTNGINSPDPHFPDKPAEVDNDFYNLAMSNMNENLYTGDIITSIYQALNDGYGDPINAGHRYNLLEPAYKSWGIGYYNGQSCHKFSSAGGGGYTNPDVVAWPSAGITTLDSIWYGTGNWTCEFRNGYSLTSSSYVIVKDLNNNKTFYIDGTGSTTLVVNTYSNLITFRDPAITTENEAVREVTIKNVKDNSGNTVDYTYRCVFLDMSKYNSGTSDLTLTLSTNELVLDENDKAKIETTLSNGSNILIWSSSDESIATVDQMGNITAKKEGTVTIQVKVLGSDVVSNCVVTVGDGGITQPPIDDKYAKGDINKNGTVDSTDAAIVLTKYKANSSTLEDLELADMNNDGVLDSTDAAMIITVYKRN